MSARAQPRTPPFHYGWVIAVASLIIGTTAYGVYYSFSLFYPVMVGELGWSRAEVSGAMTVGLVAYGLFALPMGWLLDRFGPRITIGAGGVIFAVGTVLGSQVTALWQVYALYGFVTAIGMGAAWAPLVSTVSRWFVKKRGFAVGLGGLGSGAGASVATPLVTYLIVAYGWRQAYVIAGVAAGLLIVGAAMLMWRDPRSKDGGLPYGATSPDDGTPAPPTQAEGFTVGQAMRTSSFWLTIVMFGIWWFGGSIIYVQLAPFVLEKGLDFTQAGFAVASFGIGNSAGKVLMGIISDRIGPRLAFAVTTLAAMVVMVALVPAADAWLIYVLSLAFGLSFGGGAPQLTTITVELFGLKSIGMLMGTMMALMGMIGAGGPLLGGAMFDLTGSYAPAYFIGSGLLLVTGLMAFAIRRAAPAAAIASQAAAAPADVAPTSVVTAGEAVDPDTWARRALVVETNRAAALSSAARATGDPDLAEGLELLAAQARERAFWLRRSLGEPAAGQDLAPPATPPNPAVLLADLARSWAEARPAGLDPALAERLAAGAERGRAIAIELLGTVAGPAVVRRSERDRARLAEGSILVTRLVAAGGERPGLNHVWQLPGARLQLHPDRAPRLLVGLVGHGWIGGADGARRTFQPGVTVEIGAESAAEIGAADDRPIAYYLVGGAAVTSLTPR